MNPIILALDFPHLDDARKMLSQTRDHIGMIKIGSELWAGHGPEALDLGNEFNIPIFLDLKYNDIPNTVSRSIDALLEAASYKRVDISFVSVHAFGGKEMLKAAKMAAGNRTRIAVVTLLTSLDWYDLRDFGFSDRRDGPRTIKLAQVGRDAGLDTFICSPTQIELMRKHLDNASAGTRVTLLTPGIRSEQDPEDDQKRTKPASFALRKDKADYIVIGRPITQSASPDAMAKSFHDVAIKAGR